MEPTQTPPSVEQFLAEAGRVLSAANESKLRAALESLQTVLEQLAVTAEVAESVGGDCIPLVERAVRRDGTVPIKIIQPGWGSSGYYSKEILQEKIPPAFPPGTRMFWNHDTPVEESERPEGDLSRLSAVIITKPTWLDNGPKGPGMYADAKVFSGYAGAIDEIGEHIGVSIRAQGEYITGEAAGKKGKIIKDIYPSPLNRVDFVTIPGAGGAIVQIFESAGKGALPDPKLIQRLKEARNIGEWLESRLHLTLTQIADDMFGEGRLNRDERKALSHAIGQALNAYHAVIGENAPQLYQRDIWADAPPANEIGEARLLSQAQQTAANLMEVSMSEEALKEAQSKIAALEDARQKDQAVMESMRERLILSEAKEFVSSKLATADLPDMTKNRLLRQLLNNPPIKEGRIDSEVYGKLVETAVSEAAAEIATIVGGSGKITGMGSPAQQQAPNLAESQKRTALALERLGYGGANGN